MKIAALVLLFVAVVAADLAPLLHADSTTIINGSYIVMLKDGLDILARDAHISELQIHIAEQEDESEVSFRYFMGDTYNGFAARLTPAMLKKELSHPAVKYVECDQVMSISYEQDPQPLAPLVTQTGATWGISRIAQRSLPTPSYYVYGTAGAGVDVYVIDTGILTTHVDFGNRATAVYNAITNEGPQDQNGHGTHCAGTIGGTTYGVAKQVALKAVKVLSASGSGSNTGVIAGVNYVTNNKAAGRPSVASMSLGGSASTALDDAVTASIRGGTIYSIAAGNSNANACNSSPARVATGVTVGATDNTDTRASYSNFGTCVAIFAPGSAITSDWIGGNTATNTISGTSMATPHVAGVLALQLGVASSLSPAASKTQLLNTAISGVVKSPGTGSPNTFLFSNPQ